MLMTNKMKHKDKIKKARKMRSNFERDLGISIFQSKQWTKRSQARRLKEKMKGLS